MSYVLPVIIGLLVGGGLGYALAFFLTERHGQRERGQAQVDLALAQQRASSLAEDLQMQRANAEARLGEAAAQLQAQQAQTENLRSDLAQAQAVNAGLAAQLQGSQDNIAEQRRLLDDANAKLVAAFANVSMQSLEKNNIAFLQMAESRFKTLSTEAAGSLETRKTQIEGLLKPLQEMLSQYQTRLGEIEKTRTDSYGALQKQIGTMSEIERALQTQTSQLVSALTRPNVRGQWGEITLRKLVELAGLTARCDFVEQLSLTGQDENAGRLRPDMVIQLPNNRTVVIDAKAVLAAFLEASAAPDDAARQAALRRHSQLVRARVKELSGKAYWAQFTNSPEFVVLFLPAESFLYAAVEYDALLLEDCLAAKVVLATPTTLIALLKTIEYGWRQEAISRNSEEIRRLGTEIYDRLAVLAGHMDRLGSGLDTVVGHYNNAVQSLEARLLVSARKIGELGARNDKEMPEARTVDRKAREFSAALNPDKSPLLPE